MNGLCACGCGRETGSWRSGARSGYRRYCYKRWADHGYPESGAPPQRMGTGPKADREGRVEDYAFLRARGLSRLEAAGRVGVVRRTAERYEADLRRAS